MDKKIDFKRVLAIVSIASGIGNMGLCFSVLNTILAVMAKDLGASTLELQWILNMYGIFIAPFLVLMGRLGDRYGYKKIFCVGLLFLTLSTFGTSFSNMPVWVIFFQAFFGLAGAILLPISQVLLIKMYPPSEENKAMSLWVMVGGLTLAFGPIVAGVLTEWVSWRLPFELMGVISLLSLFLAIFCIKEPERHPAQDLDIVGTMLLMLTIGFFVLAVMQTGSWRLSLVILCYVIALFLLVVLLVLEKKAKNPILQEYLLTNRTFLCAAIANALLIFYIWCELFLVPLYIQNTLGKSILFTGVLMLATTLPLTLCSLFVGKLYPRFGAKKLMVLGYLLLTVSTLLELRFSANLNILWVIVPNIFFGVAWAFIQVPAASAAMSGLKGSHAGAGAGTFNTLQEIGGVVGLTIIVTVVRLHENFLTGFHEGIWTLLIFVLLGLGFSLGLKKSS
jgi:EmrB/QacA subfamily drug resistance transporter